MEKAKAPASINLITEDSFSHSLMGKFFLWSLSVGRYIVVFTELIVILSFLSRFKLDRDLTDLNEAIARQKAIVTSYGDLEDQIRFHQDRLAVLSTNQALLDPPQILILLNQTTPPEIRFDQVNFSDGQLTLSGTSLSAPGLAQFINNLVKNPKVSEVNVGEIASESQNQPLTFSLTVTLKDQAS